jgi:hypothetical protein
MAASIRDVQKWPLLFGGAASQFRAPSGPTTFILVGENTHSGPSPRTCHLGAILVSQLVLLYRFEHHLPLCIGLKAFLKSA